MPTDRLPLLSALVRPLGYPRVEHLSDRRQTGLRFFWLDGLFAALASGFTDPYYALYMLSLHASNAQIGLVTMLSQLAGALLAMPGATIADRTGQYRQLAVWTGLCYRLMWPVMLVAPLLLGDAHAVWIIIVARVGLAGFAAFGNAAWTALSADLVPNRLRGGYFASRNIAMQIALLAAVPLAGLLVNLFGEPGGYQVNLAFALIAGSVSLYFFSKIPEHLPTASEIAHSVPFSWSLAMAEIRRRPAFWRFMLSHSTMLLGVMLGGPFIAVYMRQELGFRTGTIGLVSTAGTLASLIGMRVMGRLHDRFGITWTMRFGLGVPLITVAWLWVQHPWQGYIVSTLAALTWAGYNLGAFNLLLASTPKAHRPRYVAINTTVVALVSAAGPLLGGWLLDVVGFMPVFSFSTIVRALGLMLFFALVREPGVLEEDSDEDDADETGNVRKR